MAIFSEADKEKLRRPHVARAWFLELDLPSGLARLHNGTGRVNIGGYEWRGVTDPIGGQLVAMDNVEEPRFGQAVAVNITLSGANRAFFKSVHTTSKQIEGRRADLYFAVFDAETGEVIIGLKKLFPGKLTSPSLKWSGVGSRDVSITIESIWSSQNFPFGGKWNGADQRRRYPGDKGLDFVGVKVSENWK
ncbi:MAG: transcriptional regulator [Phyllobacterium sp.]